PAEFYAGVLTHDPGMYPRRAILSDARAHGVQILPVDVNDSWPEYRTESPRLESNLPEPVSGALRLGLQDVKGISEDEIASIVVGRPWRSFEDFCRRAEVSRPVVENLVHCGAFDEIKGRRSRRELFWSVEQGWSDRSRARAEQISWDLTISEQIQLPGILDYSEKEKVQAELEVFGIDASRHLLSFYEPRLKELGWTQASDLLKKRSNARVVVAGIKVATQTPPTKSGKRVVFLTLEDGTGQADCTFFEEAQSKYARVVFDGWILAVRGTVRRTGARGVSILAEEAIDLSLEKGSGPKVWHASGGSAGR
ncbi:MAG TPA: OB-fold nucleic acid binding domain-containing protein, partial [Actinomycetota bacterium]|nr:OB-fold nucleic acid binding domain-containing protein [Actinomycetota bacterium]